MTEDLYKDIYNKALDIISRREHSSKEVIEKLARKFTSEDLINSTIEKLISNNLINDTRFAEMYVRSRKKKGFGPKKKLKIVSGSHDDVFFPLLIYSLLLALIFFTFSSV